MEVDIHFSIVIPLYNKESTIVETLNSVLSQSYGNYEVIIVNDGSTDGSASIINEHIRDSRIRILDQTNQGVSAARNKGVKESNYDYIAFLDADDQWMPDYLNTVSIAIRKFPKVGMICCARYEVNAKTNCSTICLAKKYHRLVCEINYFENPHVFSQTSATVVSKPIFNMTNGFPIGMKKNEDFALFYSIALLSSTVYCGFPLSCYFGGIDGQATQINAENEIVSETDVCNRFNITYGLWDQLGRQNHLFQIFLKYELRHIFLSAIKKSDNKLIIFFLNNLDTGILRLFPSIELKLYKDPSFNLINKGYILFTKLLWRNRGYPRILN